MTTCMDVYTKIEQTMYNVNLNLFLNTGSAMLQYNRHKLTYSYANIVRKVKTG